MATAFGSRVRKVQTGNVGDGWLCVYKHKRCLSEELRGRLRWSHLVGCRSICLVVLAQAVAVSCGV